MRIDTFTGGYLEAAAWTSLDEEGLPSGQMDVHWSQEAIAQAVRECRDFQEAHRDTLAPFDAARAGHDFWLNRNGHGAGFWDGDYPEPAASILDRAAKQAGERDLYIGDDGRIYWAQADGRDGR